MLKQDIFNHYSAILDNLLTNSLWMQAYLQRPWYFGKTIEGDSSEYIPDGINIKNGSTRACIIDESYDWVVKYDIADNGVYDSACECEEELYEEAKKLNIEYCLCDTMYVGTYTKTYSFYNIEDIEQYCSLFGYDEELFEEELERCEEELQVVDVTVNIPLYAYRRAEMYDYSALDENLINSAQKIESPLRKEQIAVATAFIQEYGFDAYCVFSAFATEHNINDLHEANIGSLDGRFVILDWGSYYKD